MRGGRLVSWLGGVLNRGSSEHIWRPSLESISDRNGPVELTTNLDADAESPDSAIRTRLLRFDRNGMLVERPIDVAARRLLRPGVRVRLLTLDGDHRWEVVTQVVGIGETRLSERVLVQTVALGPPVKVSSDQRRDYFRVSTAGVALPPVTLRPVGQPRTDKGVPVDGVSFEPFDAALLNLGGGGMSVNVLSTKADQGLYFTNFIALLRLPVEHGALEIPVHVTHREVSYDDSLHLGLSFEYERVASQHYCEDVICHFTTEVQRHQLQRQRGAG